MGTTVGDIIQEAVEDLYNNPATANDLFSPAFIARSINRALRRYWRIFQDNEWGYYRFSEKVLLVDQNTNIYALPNGNPANPDGQNVAIVTAMAQLLSGAGANARFCPLYPFFPTDKYKTAGVFTNSYAYLTNQAGGSGVPSWALERGIPDADGFPQYWLRFKPWWTGPATVLYDGVRYPILIIIGDDGSVDDAQITDIPDHLNDNIKLRVLKDCFIRAKVGVEEINAEIKQLDDEAFKVEERSIERQGSNMIRRTGGSYGMGGNGGPYV